jgi:hypothetical protein
VNDNPNEDRDDDLTLGEQAIRDAFDNAEPPRDTLAWAKFTIDRYEPLISGPRADITKVYEPLYLEAVAITSIEEPDYYARLHQKLKSRGVRIGDWERRVRDTERRIKQEREDKAKATVRPKQATVPKGGQESQATELVKLAVAAGAELFHDEDGGYATVPINNHFETHPLRSRMFRRWMTHSYYTKSQKAPNAEALQAAINTLDAKARFEGAQIKTWLRLAAGDGKLYLDLADQDWRMVEVDRGGWHIIKPSRPPVRFRRPPGMLPLPAPVDGGSIDNLHKYLNVASDEDFRLAVAWLIGCYRERGPFPILILNGEQGTGKSTVTRVLRDLVDPNIAPIRSEPRESRDLMISANNGCVCSFDNLSHLPVWLSDALCRLSTGGGFSVRTNYSDDEETLFVAQRPVILNGIEELAVRGDLVERAINADLERIAASTRKAEAALYQAFYAARPGIMGAFLHAVSTALRRGDEVQLEELPRMADFSLWVVAAEPALTAEPGLEWKDGDFLQAYTRNRAAANRLPLEASPVPEAILQLREGFTGTATDLLSRLDGLVDEQKRKLKSWPHTPRRLSGILRRLAPHLTAIGVDVTFERATPSARQRLIKITIPTPDTNPPPVGGGNPSSEPSETPKTQENQGFPPYRVPSGPPSGLSSEKFVPKVSGEDYATSDATHLGENPEESRVFDRSDGTDAKIPGVSDGVSEKTHIHGSTGFTARTTTRSASDDGH